MTQILNNRNSYKHKYTTSGWSIIVPNGKTTVEMKATKDVLSIDFMLRESTNLKSGKECALYWAIEYGI